MRLLHNSNTNKFTEKDMPDELKKMIIHDLDIKTLAKHISMDSIYETNASKLIDMMSDKPEEIKYRQQFSKVLYENERLYDEFFRIYHKLTGLQEIASKTTQASNKSIANHDRIINWIDLFCGLVTDIVELFEKNPNLKNVESLKELNKKINEINESEEFTVLVENVNNVKTKNHKLNSIKMGINLNSYLEPVGLNCLQVDDHYYFPKKVADIRKNDGKIHGIGKFKYQPRGRIKQGDMRYDEMSAPAVLVDTTKLQRILSCEINIEYMKSMDSFLKDLNFNNSNLVKNFILKKIGDIIDITEDLGFFLGGIKMIKQLSDKGMPVTLPVISEKQSYFSVNNLYNCYLPYIMENPSEKIILNDFNLDDQYSFSILNGPNKGGKTTFIQGICLSIILFQLGLYTPCSQAEISPFDMILTHYQNEDRESRAGRLATDAEEIRKIFRNATAKSLVIFNEPYVSTSPAEGRFLILSSLSGVRKLGFRGILVTHYHKLNDQVDEDNKNSKKKIAFFNMGIDSDGNDTRRTYELIKGRGEVQSYAIDILREYAPGLLG